jgi:hypothetical protein
LFLFQRFATILETFSHRHYHHYGALEFIQRERFLLKHHMDPIPDGWLKRPETKEWILNNMPRYMHNWVEEVPAWLKPFPDSDDSEEPKNEEESAEDE